MIVITDYCRQLGAYRHSVGKCVVELENDETIDDVKAKYIIPRQWFEVKYSNPRLIDEYEGRKGRFVIMDTMQQYLD